MPGTRRRSALAAQMAGRAAGHGDTPGQRKGTPPLALSSPAAIASCGSHPRSPPGRASASSLPLVADRAAPGPLSLSPGTDRTHSVGGGRERARETGRDRGQVPSGPSRREDGGGQLPSRRDGKERWRGTAPLWTGRAGREGGMEGLSCPPGGSGRLARSGSRGCACDEPGRREAARRGGVTAAALIRPGLALAEGCLPPPAPEHAVLPRAGAGAELAAGRPGAAAALAVPAGAVPLREARGAAVPAAGSAAGALRLVPAGAALLPGARAAAGAAQPAPPRAARLPPPLLPLLLALLLQVPPRARLPQPRLGKLSQGELRERPEPGGPWGRGRSWLQHPSLPSPAGHPRPWAPLEA